MKNWNFLELTNMLTTECRIAMRWMHNHGDQDRLMDGSFYFSYTEYLQKQKHHAMDDVMDVALHMKEFMNYHKNLEHFIPVLCDITLKYIVTPTGYKVQPVHNGRLVSTPTRKVADAIAYLFGLKYVELHEGYVDVPYANNSKKSAGGKIPTSLRAMRNMDLIWENYMSRRFLSFCSAVSYYDDLQNV